MKRNAVTTHPDWEKECDSIGFIFRGSPTDPYWTNGVGYEFTSSEVDALEEATADLHAMCMEYVGDVVRTGDYPAGYGLSELSKALIEGSWKVGHPHLYGRFDLAFRPGDGPPKLLEYNADTPTALFEAAVVNWHWIKMHGKPDQFSSIHEELIKRWGEIMSWLETNGLSNHLTFSAMKEGGAEDWATLTYLADTAVQAKFRLGRLALEEMTWNASASSFVYPTGQPVDVCFALYPKEWMVQDEFGGNIPNSKTLFIEPFWKMLLSNKGLLAELWRRHPDHPLLLPTFYEQDPNARTMRGRWARKPTLSREGANVGQLVDGTLRKIEGVDQNPIYANAPHVLQQWYDLPTFGDNRAVIGSWVIGNTAAGIGVREEAGLVTTNASRFVPHWFQ